MIWLVISGLVLVITLLITACRFISLRRILGYAAVVDVLTTLLMFAMFFGTLGGIISGAFAGLFMTALLSLGRAVIGYEKFVVVWPHRDANGRWRGFSGSWRAYPARFQPMAFASRLVPGAIRDLFKREAWG